MDWGIVARIVHVLAVVVWVGGVWFVTAVVLPAMREKPSQEWLVEFNAVERRFALQARVAVLLVLLSGLYMLYRYSLWDRFVDARYWWMHLMVAVWLLFAVLLYVLKPLVVHRVIDRRASADAWSDSCWCWASRCWAQMYRFPLAPTRPCRLTGPETGLTVRSLPRAHR